MSTVTSFDLHKLGWKAFEDLVGCVLGKVMGQTFQVFSQGADGGRDGLFKGVWSVKGGEVASGKFVVQCKHTTKHEHALSKSIIKLESEKLKKMVGEGNCDTYILITNHSLSAPLVSFAEKSFEDAGAKKVLVFGSDWLCKTICEEPLLRRLVPRLYGLGDLTQIVTHQAYAQARAVLDGLLPDLQCFVPTEAYRKSAHALAEEKFVLLLGEPASGKTMIANLLAISAADQWGLETVMLTSPESFDKLWNPDDPGQFIWVDDAFGATQCDQNRVREWNHRLPKLKAAIHGGARVVFTSRDYVFNAAKSDLKISAFELFDESRVTIHVEELSLTERQMILYNHLKAGKQSNEFLKSIVPYLDKACGVKRFLPDVARRLGSPKFTKKLATNEASIVNFFDSPMDVLEDVIENLGAAEKCALALVFMHGGKLKCPIPENKRTRDVIASMGSNVGEVKKAFSALDDSMIGRVNEGDDSFWRFRHPTMGDAFASVVANNPELIEVYLSGVSTERLLSEVTCGDVGMTGVKIVIPKSKFADMISRLKSYKQPTGRFYFQDPLMSFLATRCSAGFLKEWYVNEKQIIDLVKDVGYVGRYDDSLQVLRTLNAAGLLPEPVRVKLVARIRTLSEATFSVSFMSDYIVGSLISASERLELYAGVTDTTLSNVSDYIREVRANWDHESDPGDDFHDMRKTLEHISENGSDDAMQRAARYLDKISTVVSEMEDEREEITEAETLSTEESVVLGSNRGRSVFDDLLE